ncbi:LLM class flavin-dependent oxidoreductase [Pseudonocardia bannensis]|uniref:LLM class flavin-dependent oxidoreductase n=1 Tax=Pseudonocardia bannensis TaxID=630973 RepID=A0A848DCU1_9PSEU|nr:LLM class flavin-dependent oxidoreductase [Pseudonocardia bannensis]NMH90392.1 LLM class flavin-dependent oxidoreductase [Pseudonocardia bannensis]
MQFSGFSVTDHYPNEPRTIRDFYGEILDEIVLAERLGFRNYFVAEHHFHEYGVVSSPTTLLAAAAGRTTTIGLGVAVSVLPFHNPLVVAQDYAMLDQLSDGRLAMGVGSGYLKHEFDGFNLGPWEKRARFDEAIEIIERAWTGEPFSYHGLYHHVQNTRIAITPIQQPPPTWVAVIRPEAAYYVGRQGRNLMLIPYATASTMDELRQTVQEYQRGRQEAGHEGPADVAAALHTYVGVNDASARAEAEPALDRYVDTRLYSRSKRRFDDLNAAELILIGGPETVAKRVMALADVGVNHLMLLGNFGAMNAKRCTESLERFAADVAPATL